MIRSTLEMRKDLAGWRYLLFTQIFISAVFVVGGAAFPFYIAFKYGKAVRVIYDRFGNAIGEASYVLLGAGLGLFVVALGLLGLLVALRILRKQPNGQK